MTIASEILKKAENCNKLIGLCENHPKLKKTEQDFDEGMTTFIFSDDSKIEFSGPDYDEII